MFYTLSIGFVIIILFTLSIRYMPYRAQAISPSHHQHLLRFTIAYIYRYRLFAITLLCEQSYSIFTYSQTICKKSSQNNG